MSGILGEIAAAKSLAEDLCNCVCRLRSAGADIDDLDLKLRNDRFLLLRYHNVLSQRLSLLQDNEIDHLRDYIRAISRMLLESVKKIKWYEKRGRLGKAMCGVFEKEFQERETKLAGWIGELMSWAVLVGAAEQNVPNYSLQINQHPQQHRRNSPQAKSIDSDDAYTPGHKRLLDYADNTKILSQRPNYDPSNLQLVKDDNKGTKVGPTPMYTQTKVCKPLERSGWGDTFSCEVRLGLDLDLNNTQHVRRQEQLFFERTDFENKLNESEQLIGYGASSKVYKAEMICRYFNAQIKCQYAVKRFTSSNYDHFKHEAAASQDLRRRPHDHIIPLLHAWVENGIGNLLFPLAQGDLGSLLMNISPTPGNGTEQWMVSQMTGVVSACNSIFNAGSVHGDLKPENILMYYDRRKSCSRWVVADFGNSKKRSIMEGIENLPSASSFSESGKAPSTTSPHNGTEMYTPPERRCNRDNDDSSDMWALGCIFLEVLAWYLHPTGYTAQGFHHSRVHTIGEDGATAAEDPSSAKFWALDGRARPILHPSVRQWLSDIKELAQSSNWLLDVPYHVERLLSIRSDARYTASDFETILQHSLALKKMALGDCPGYAVLDGGPLPIAHFSLDAPGGSPTFNHGKQPETAHTQTVPISSPLSSRELQGLSLRTALGPRLRKRGNWGSDKVRSRYLEHE